MSSWWSGTMENSLQMCVLVLIPPLSGILMCNAWAQMKVKDALSWEIYLVGRGLHYGTQWRWWRGKWCWTWLQQLQQPTSSYNQQHMNVKDTNKILFNLSKIGFMHVLGSELKVVVCLKPCKLLTTEQAVSETLMSKMSKLLVTAVLPTPLMTH